MIFSDPRLAVRDPGLAAELGPCLRAVVELVDPVAEPVEAPDGSWPPVGLHALVCLLCAQLGRWRPEPAATAAAAAELTYLAALHHGHVLDVPPGQPGLARQGRSHNEQHILAGDRCLAHAAVLAVRAGTDIFRTLASGLAAAQQARLVPPAGDRDGPDRDGPTAPLLAAAAGVGAAVAGCRDDLVGAATACGRALGDCLDQRARPAEPAVPGHSPDTPGGPAQPPAAFAAHLPAELARLLAALPAGRVASALAEVAGALRAGVTR